VSPNLVEEIGVEPDVAGHFGVKSGAKQVTLLHGDDATVRKGGECGCPRSEDVNDRGADEDGMHRFAPEDGDVEVGLERVELGSESIAANHDVESPEGLLPRDAVENAVGEEDQPRAGPIDGQTGGDRPFQGVGEAERPGQLVLDARLSARKDESVDGGQFFWPPDVDDIRAEPAQNERVLTEIALKGENSDKRRATTSHVRRGGAARRDRRR